MTVLPKPNKDPLDCTSYRPISLLNTDLNIYAKILANHLRPLLHTLIGPEQVGFMPGREAKDNVIKALNLIHKSRTDDLEGYSPPKLRKLCVVGLSVCHLHTYRSEATHDELD